MVTANSALKQCVNFIQCEDAAIFSSSLDPLWVFSHWICCCTGISTACCCIGWTYGSCAWQCCLWHYYRASSWLQSPSIFLPTPSHIWPFLHVGIPAAYKCLHALLLMLTPLCLSQNWLRKNVFSLSAELSTQSFFLNPIVINDLIYNEVPLNNRKHI